MSTQQIDRGSHWFLTFSGKRFFPTEPMVEDICIEDIAHALANTCRFGGHTRSFYSVAQHSVHVAEILPAHLKAQGLMHDATEAYVGDMVRPLKIQLPSYKEVEDNLWAVICHKFGLEQAMDPAIKWADNVLLMTERRDLIIPTDDVWSMAKSHPPLQWKIKPMTPKKAERFFLEAIDNIL